MSNKENKEISINDLMNERAEIAKSFNDTLNARNETKYAFYNDCEAVDELIESRKQELVKEISECEAKMDLLKSQWAAAVSAKDNAIASNLEDEIAMLQAKMTTKEQLINTVKGEYNPDLLQAFLEADRAHKRNVFNLQAKMARFINKVDSIIEELNTVKNIGEYKYSEYMQKERDNAERRFKHEREFGLDEWPDTGKFIEMHAGIPTYGR